MTAETIITTATTIAVRALIDGIAALREGAKADERAEIDRLLARLHETAPEPVASSLDGITDRHLARVRADVAEHNRRFVAAWEAAPNAADPFAPTEGEDPDQ